MKRIVGVLVGFLILLVKPGLSQTTQKQNVYIEGESLSCREDFDSLFNVCVSTAFEAYPELQDISINFKEKTLKTIMAARPKISSMLANKKKRKYQILISNNKINGCEQLFCQITPEALTGILGHELAHILTYRDKSSAQMIFYAIKYLVNKREIERDTDKIAISRGFGNELLEYNLYVLKSKLVSEKYLQKRSENYLSVNEIREKMHE